MSPNLSEITSDPPGLCPVQSPSPAIDGWQPATRKELRTLVAFFVGVIVATDVVNVRLGVELLTVAVTVAALGITKKPRWFLRDWWWLLVGLYFWTLSGPIAALSPVHAHLDFMLQFDRFLFFGHDPVVVIQHGLAPANHHSWLDLSTVVAYNLHVPEPYLASYFLWRLNRTVFFQFAAASLILLVLGYVTFIAFPAIPPWMASGWYHRLPHIINGFGPVLAQHPLPFHGAPTYSLFPLHGDAVAAFPSEHAAFPLLEYLAFRCIAPRASRLFLLWVAWVLFSIVYLGEHWIVDALAGWLYALVIFAAVRRFTRAKGLPGGKSVLAS